MWLAGVAGDERLKAEETEEAKQARKAKILAKRKEREEAKRANRDLFDSDTEGQNLSMGKRVPESIGGRTQVSEDTPWVPVGDGQILTGPGAIEFLPMGKRAYHGTPHEVKGRMSLDKIGTGEGNIAFGWGLYFGERKSTGEWYRDTLSRDLPEYTLDGNPIDTNITGYPSNLSTTADIVRRIGAAGGKDTAVLYAEKQLEATREHHERLRKLREKFPDIRRDGETEEGNVREAKEEIEKIENLIKDLRAFDESRVGRVPERGNLYTIELDVEDNELLNWDERIAELDPIMKAANKLFRDRFDYPHGAYWQGGAASGASFYASVAKAVSEQLGKKETHGRQPTKGEAKLASAFLRDAGILGIRFLDGESRGRSGLKGVKQQYLDILTEDAEVDEVNEAVDVGRCSWGHATFRDSCSWRGNIFYGTRTWTRSE